MISCEPIHEKSITEIISAVRLGLTIVIASRKQPNPDREGGYFTLRDRRTAEVLLVIKFGRFTEPDRHLKCRSFSLEKTDRLLIFQHHVSSHQSRNPDSNLWGGAIAFGDFILSFSGFPELEDEAAMLFAACELGWMHPSNAAYIASLSSNDAYDRLLAA